MMKMRCPPGFYLGAVVKGIDISATFSVPGGYLFSYIFISLELQAWTMVSSLETHEPSLNSWRRKVLDWFSERIYLSFLSFPF